MVPKLANIGRSWCIVSGMKSASVVAVMLMCVAYSFATQNPSPSPTANSYQKSSRPSRLRVSSGVMAGLMIRHVDPVYPAEAKKKHISGDVLLKILINKEGHVVDAVIVKGDPMLASAAMEAVKQWRFQPYLLDGEPIEVETTAVAEFRQMTGRQRGAIRARVEYFSCAAPPGLASLLVAYPPLRLRVRSPQGGLTSRRASGAGMSMTHVMLITSGRFFGHLRRYQGF
jgi:TonB family protein